MAIDFNRDRWDRVKAVHRQWWSGELDRPLFLLTSGGRDPGRVEPALRGRHFTSHYRKIRKAGKLVQVFTGQDESGFRLLDTLVEQVGSPAGIALIGSVEPPERQEAEALMRRYGWRE